MFLCQDKKMGTQLSCATGAAAVGWLLFTQGWEGERGVVYDGTCSGSAGGGQIPGHARPREFELLSSCGCLGALQDFLRPLQAVSWLVQIKQWGCDFSLKTK